jgi:type IV pilus assembly protein PilM
MQQVVGLDIGTSAVRAAELDLGSGAPALHAFGQVGLPPGTIVDGEVRDPSAVSDALRRLWQNGKFTSRTVVVGIAGLRAITRELDLPWVPDDEVDSAVRFQSEEVIPFAPDQTLLSAQVLGDTMTADGAKARRVLVAAAHRELVDSVVDAVEKAGLEVEGVDLVSSALVRALVDPSKLTDQPEAIVSVGAGLTVIVVHQNGRPLFVRTVGTGGHAATEAISQALDLPVSDAEGMKRRLNGTSNPQLDAAKRASAAVVEDLVNEIRNSIQYFSSLPGHPPVTRILVTGGSSRLQGFLARMQEAVRIPVAAVSPLERLDLSGVELDDEQAAILGPVLATSVGLSLPEPNTAVRKFNLVPPEILQRAFVRKVTRYTMFGAAALVALVVLFAGYRIFAVHNTENDVSSLRTQVATLNAEIPKYNAVVKAVNELRTARGQVTRLTSSAVDWAHVVAELDRVTPQSLGVTTFAGQSATATPAAGSSAPPSGAAQAVPGSIGTVTVSVAGTFPATAHFSPVAQWIDAISGSKLFNPPAVSAVANVPAGGNTTVTFQSTISLTSLSSLAKNGTF